MIFKSKPRYDQLDHYLARRDYTAALEAVSEELKRRPEDFNLLLRHAEILGLAGDKEHAVVVYRKLARHFADQGFYARAIAVNNKILRLDPSRREVTDELAELIAAREEEERLTHRAAPEAAAAPAVPAFGPTTAVPTAPAASMFTPPTGVVPPFTPTPPPPNAPPEASPTPAPPLTGAPPAATATPTLTSPPTSTPPTASPTPTPPSTGTPPAATATSTHTPTGASPTATSTSAPAPTPTLTPTSTPTLLPAPLLIEPEDGASFPVEVRLKWGWFRRLEDDEKFAVRWEPVGGQATNDWWVSEDGIIGGGGAIIEVEGRGYIFEVNFGLGSYPGGEAQWSVAIFGEIQTEKWQISEWSEKRLIYHGAPPE